MPKILVSLFLSLSVFLLIPAPMQQAQASPPIQSRKTMDGNLKVNVVKARVRNGILTIMLVYRNIVDRRVRREGFWTNGVYYIDEKNKKKYHVLRDDRGDYIAAPGGRAIDTESIQPGKKELAWFMFPAPPVNVKRITLVVPYVLPFEGLPIKR